MSQEKNKLYLIQTVEDKSTLAYPTDQWLIVNGSEQPSLKNTQVIIEIENRPSQPSQDVGMHLLGKTAAATRKKALEDFGKGISPKLVVSKKLASHSPFDQDKAGETIPVAVLKRVLVQQKDGTFTRFNPTPAEEKKLGLVASVLTSLGMEKKSALLKNNGTTSRISNQDLQGAHQVTGKEGDDALAKNISVLLSLASVLVNSKELGEAVSKKISGVMIDVGSARANRPVPQDETVTVSDASKQSQQNPNKSIQAPPPGSSEEAEVQLVPKERNPIGFQQGGGKKGQEGGLSSPMDVSSDLIIPQKGVGQEISKEAVLEIGLTRLKILSTHFEADGNASELSNLVNVLSAIEKTLLTGGYNDAADVLKKTPEQVALMLVAEINKGLAGKHVPEDTTIFPELQNNMKDMKLVVPQEGSSGNQKNIITRIFRPT